MHTKKEVTSDQKGSAIEPKIEKKKTLGRSKFKNMLFCVPLEAKSIHSLPFVFVLYSETQFHPFCISRSQDSPDEVVSDIASEFLDATRTYDKIKAGMSRNIAPGVNQHIRELICEIDKMRAALSGKFASQSWKDVTMSEIVELIKQLEAEYAKVQEQQSAP